MHSKGFISDSLQDIGFLLQDFYNIFFPRKCVYCGKNLNKTEKEICIKCLSNLPRTGFINFSENPVFQSFWGRVPVGFAFSMYYFVKQSVLQYLLHQIKYHGRKELAYVLGTELGKEIAASKHHVYDAIVPVPLHPDKEKRRGYNQSEWIAQGISFQLKIPLETKLIRRHINSKSQTRKNRAERWENVRNAFSITTYQTNDYKHVLLVDDVLTTGATLEACASLLIEQLKLKVSIATLAYATD